MKQALVVAGVGAAVVLTALAVAWWLRRDCDSSIDLEGFASVDEEPQTVDQAGVDADAAAAAAAAIVEAERPIVPLIAPLVSVAPPYPPRKIALLFGLNYSGTSAALSGCINDVENVRAALIQHFGFTSANIQIMTDRTVRKPTRVNMLSALTAFVGGLRAGDKAVLWYSGHGTQVRLAASSTQEADGLDEAWCPLDYETAGLITDSQLNQLLARAPAGCSLFVGSDSCHSATVADLRYALQVQGERRIVISGASASQLELEMQPLAGGEAGSYVPLPHSQAAPTTTTRRPDHEARMRGIPIPSVYPPCFLVPSTSVPDTRARVVLLSGCKDAQTSADTTEDRQAQGAMTWAFLSALRTLGPAAPIGNLAQAVRALLRGGGYTQIPQLSAGRTFDVARTSLADVIA